MQESLPGVLAGWRLMRARLRRREAAGAWKRFVSEVGRAERRGAENQPGACALRRKVQAFSGFDDETRKHEELRRRGAPANES